jgi:acyl transferase domain-containing protein/NADPH:quinone reductase-like Zn-dependent oxidoreductase/SAM-dependent methyltransferase/acyl carrier protein
LSVKARKSSVPAASTGSIDTVTSRSTTALAIVGVSGRYPKAENLDVLWANLKAGVDGVGEAQGDRWDLGFHSKDSQHNNRVYTKAGGFLDRIDLFDAEFFGISPREAQQVDPQHRLMLELSWEAMESAGMAPEDLAGTKTGVFIGVSNNDYSGLVGQENVNAYTNIGSALSICANRISYQFDLHGPSMSIDTACSSSMVALHQACRAILSGECEMALVGGVNILASMKPWIGFAQATMLSPDGRCKSFDADGQGYVRAEGGGVVIIKPLADAERDGDDIWGVILGTGVNSDGRTMGMAMPSGEAQEALLRQVYTACGVDPEQVFYVEAHGTGTAVGDPIECGAIGRVLGAPRQDGSQCLIGSVKSNIGHLESGAGIAGLTKLLLAMRHREIPANLHFNTPNPKIDFEGWKLRVADEAIPLPDRETPLVFGVNSFGFGGTNAHCVLQEYRAPAKSAAETAPVDETSEDWGDLLLLSAHSPEALEDLAAAYVPYVKGQSARDWRTTCAALALTRAQHTHRLVVSASSGDEAAARLEAHLAGEKTGYLAKGKAGAKPAKTALVFSGNGPQWWGMGREMYAQSQIFRDQIEAIDALFSPKAGWSLAEEMKKPESENRISLTEIAQPMLFAQQVALTAVLNAAGIKPDVVFGHSVGEAAAAWASGALTLEQAVDVIFHRSQMQALTAGRGRMAAVGLSAAEAEAAMAEIDGWLEIAAINSPRAVTVAGELSALEILRDRLTDEGKFVRILPLNYPFHTKAMDTIQGPLLLRLADLKPQAGRIPFISTVTGESLDGKALDNDYWWRNIRAPVQFDAAAAHALTAHKIDLFIEVGPHPVLKEYLVQAIKAAEGVSATAHSTLRRPAAGRPAPELETLKTAICGIYAAGGGQPKALFTKPEKPVKLPAYPWRKSRHWRGGCELPETTYPLHRDHPLLGHRLPTSDGVWTNTVQPMLLPYLNDHVVQGAPLFPAAGYIELALAAGGIKFGEGALDVEAFEILRPLVLPEGAEPIVQISVDGADGTLAIRSRADTETADWTDHVRGRLSKAEGVEVAPFDLDALRRTLPIAVDAPTHYRGCDRRGLTYGPFFQGVTGVILTPPDAEQRAALGEIVLPQLDEAALAGYRAHPSIVDSCLQVLIALIGQKDLRDCATIPVQLGRVRSFAPLPSHIVCHVQLLRENARSGVADITLCDTDGNVLMILSEARFQKVEFRPTALPLLVEDWRPDAAWTPRRAAPLDLPAPEDIAARVAPAIAEITQAFDRARFYSDIQPRLEALAGAYAADALEALGAAHEPFSLMSLAEKAGVAADQRPLLARLIAMAQTDGVIACAQPGPDARWTWKADAERIDVQAEQRALMLDHPEQGAELTALARLGAHLVARLRGEAAGQTGVAMLEALEDTAPFRAPYNRMAAEALRETVAAWPANCFLRVLELNGGTGGLTAALLPILPPERTDYVFADTSEQALARAKSRFGAHHFLRTAKQDDEVFVEAGFDLVIAAATTAAPPLSSAFEHLAPGGLLLLVAPQGSRFTDLIFPDAPLGDALAELKRAGFELSAMVSDSEAAFGAAQYNVLVARKPLAEAEAAAPLSSSEPKHRVILADETLAKSEFVSRLIETLTQAGDRATVLPLTSADVTEEGLKALVTKTSDADEIVHLAGWASSPTGPADVLAHQDLRCLSTILLARAIESYPIGHPETVFAPTLTLVTRGGMTGPGGAGPLDPFQAPLAGLGRVIANEQASLGCRLIDLHCASDDLAAAEDLAAALIARDDEAEVLLLDGRRYLNRARVSPVAEQARIARFLPKTPGEAQPDDAAFRLDFLPQGGFDSLHLRQIPRRAPGAGAVELKVHAAGLNFRDVLWTMGMLPEDAVEHGFSGATIGMECAGEVARVGQGVTTLKPGDRVIAFASSTFASHVTTKADSVAPLPDAIPYAAGATIPTTFVTAWYALDHLARLEPGESVLIHGAAGGVGLAALQIAKLKGAVVFASAGSDDKQRLVRAMGADHVLSSRSLKFADDIMRLTGGKGVDIVLNSLAGEAITKGLQVLKPFGRFLEIGKRDLYANSRIGLRPFRQNLSYFGIDADTLLVERPALAKRVFDQVIAAMARGELKPLPHQATPISRAAEAFRAMQQSRHIGKLVVTMDGEPQDSLAVVPALATLFRPDVTYLVTGGLGGFGLATALWMADQGARSFALMSRRGEATEEAKAGLAELRAKGAVAKPFAVDVADAAQVEKALAEIRATMAPLKGVVHAAAVIEDAPLMNIDQGLMHRVMSAKMIGAWNLHTATLSDELELFALYSSSSAVIGNPGQGCYVAANMFLDSLAQYRRAQGLAGLSVGWGAIKDAGFLTRNAAVEEMLSQRAGMEATAVRDAMAAFGQLIASGAVKAAAAQFNLMRLGQSLAGARTPRFLPLLPEGMSMAAEGAGSLAAALEAMGEDDRRTLILTRVREHVARVVGAAVAQIEADRALSELGLDSLMAVELAEALEHDVGRPISVMLMIQAGTVGGVVEAVLRGFRTAKPAAAVAQTAPSQPVNIAA